jgi:hypothetical protein
MTTTIMPVGPTTSMAISCMWAWMIPHFYIEFTEYRLVLDKIGTSRVRSTSDDNSGDDNSGDGNSGDDNESASFHARETANRATVRGVCFAVSIIGTFYIGAVLAVGILTRQPDPTILTKSNAIAIGVGRMLSACLLAYFSVELPRWLGVTYASQKHVKYYKQLDEKSLHRELSFRVCWSFLGHFFIMFPFLVFYFCNETLGTVALSTAVGIFFGFTIVYCVWLGHTKLSYKNRTRFAALLSSLITLTSAAAFSAGCWYVKEVWHDNTEFTDEYTTATFFVWLLLCLVVHAMLCRLTQRKLAEAAKTKLLGTIALAMNITDETEVEVESEEVNICPESVKGEWRYRKQVFQPPRSISYVAGELQNSFTSLPTLLKRARQKLNESNSIDNEEDENENATSVDGRPSTESTVNNEPTGLDIDVGSFSTTNVSTSRGRRGSFVTCFTDTSSIEEIIDIEDDVDARGTDLSLNDLEDACVPEDKFPIITEGNLQVELPLDEPTIWHMARVNSCCRRQKHYNAPPRKGCNLLLAIFKWTLWTIVAGLHVTVTVINIGATQQQAIVRRALPGTYETFYPENYASSTMCAWNKASPDADIRTFDSLEDVIAANYTVLHCGACGHCSNWNDISLQWTTRDHLADIARSCTTRSFFGSVEDVQECNEESIGFTEECSTCWTVDELCARDNCSFIYLQSVFTNQVQNYNVGPNDITSATCDEALCGPEFVPCVGATRRRMNIVSDIPRPISQQCHVASEDWSTVFDHP